MDYNRLFRAFVAALLLTIVVAAVGAIAIGAIFLTMLYPAAAIGLAVVLYLCQQWYDFYNQAPPTKE